VRLPPTPAPGSIIVQSGGTANRSCGGSARLMFVNLNSTTRCADPKSANKFSSFKSGDSHRSSVIAHVELDRATCARHIARVDVPRNSSMHCIHALDPHAGVQALRTSRTNLVDPPGAVLPRGIVSPADRLKEYCERVEGEAVPAKTAARPAHATFSASTSVRSRFWISLGRRRRAGRRPS
jgi:hypothetical protein